MSSPQFAHDSLSPHTRLADLVTTPSRRTTTTQEQFTPSDSYNLVKFSMFILGIGTLLSPNALLLCASYYDQQYPNISNLIYYIMPTYSISNITLTIILTKSKWGTKLSFTFRIVISFLLSAITVICLAQSNETWSLIILLSIVFVIGMTSAILNLSLLGFSNILQSSYKHIFISGEALSAIVASITRVITRICYKKNVVASSNTYFIFIATYCIFCAVLFALIRFTKYVAFSLNIYILQIAQYKSNGNKVHLFSPYTQKLLQQSLYLNDETCSQNNNNIAQTTGKQQNININTKQFNSFDEEKYLNKSLSQTQGGNDKMLTTSLSLLTVGSSQFEEYERMDLQSSSTIADLHAIQPQTLQSAQNNTIKAAANHGVDITNFLNSLNYKPNMNASLKDGNNHSLPSLLSSAQSYHSMHENRAYSSILFNDTDSKKFEWNRMSKKIRLYCYIISIANILTWSTVPGLISGDIKSDLPFIAANDWQSILLMSEYFCCEYVGRLIISSPTFWWFCCEYEDQTIYNNAILIQQIVIRNLGCCPMCCGKSNFVISHTFLLRICLFRLLLYPIFFCVYTNLFDNQFDFMAHFLMLFIGITQGYIYRMTFTMAPQFVPKYKREAITSVLRLFHFGGIAVGSIIALIVVYVVQKTHLL